VSLSADRDVDRNMDIFQEVSPLRLELEDDWVLIWRDSTWDRTDIGTHKDGQRLTIIF